MSNGKYLHLSPITLYNIIHRTRAIQGAEPMRKLVRIVGLVAALIIGLLLVVLVGGLLLPEEHHASRTLVTKQPPQAIWDTINDHANEPKWRSDIESVTSLGERNGKPKSTSKGWPASSQSSRSSRIRQSDCLLPTAGCGLIPRPSSSPGLHKFPPVLQLLF